MNRRRRAPKWEETPDADEPPVVPTRRMISEEKLEHKFTSLQNMKILRPKKKNGRTKLRRVIGSILSSSRYHWVGKLTGCCRSNRVAPQGIQHGGGRQHNHARHRQSGCAPKCPSWLVRIGTNPITSFILAMILFGQFCLMTIFVVLWRTNTLTSFMESIFDLFIDEDEMNETDYDYHI